MQSGSRKSLSRVVALLLGLVGVSLCAVGLAPPAGAQDFRALQVWPDRGVGVSSGLLEGLTAYADTRVFPFGVYTTSDDEVLYGRTYLHFPLDVFPPGTDIRRATLHVYVDGASGAGEATLGAYRVVDPWGETGWTGDPGTWPEVLRSPIAITTARFGAVAPGQPASTAGPTATPSTTPTPGPTATPSTTPTPGRTATPSVTPTPDQTATPSMTPTPSITPTPTITATATITPTPTLTGTEESRLFAKPAGLALALAQATATSSGSPLATATSPSSPLATPTRTPTPSRTPTPGPSPTSTPGPSPTPSPTLQATSTAIAPYGGPVVSLGQVSETWLTWDVTALVRAWLARQVADEGLALAPAPDPDADPETAGDLFVARWLAVDDPATRPYLIVEFEVQPVTPTPAPVLPPAGGDAGWGAVGVVLVGAALVVLGMRWTVVHREPE